MIKLADESICTGCALCHDVCTTGAIIMSVSEDGFKYPIIDSNKCIKCGKCVKYCPGNALLGNYEMNPKRCLSYITQKKGDLEEEEEKVLKENKKVFGCDICQDICPHNKNIPITSIERFKQDTILKLDAEEINDISNKEFKRRYGNRAFSWRGKNIIKRNINIVSEKPNE